MHRYTPVRALLKHAVRVTWPILVAYGLLYAAVLLSPLIDTSHREEPDLQAVESGIPNMLVPLLIFAGSAVMLEKNEERYKGYEILKRLPVKPQTVYFSRILFILSLTGIGLICNFAFLLSKRSHYSNPGLPIGQSFFMFTLTLIFLGILYPSILKKGYSATSLWIWPPYFLLIFIGASSNTRLFTRFLPFSTESFYNPSIWGILLFAATLFLFLRGPAAVRALQQRR